MSDNTRSAVGSGNIVYCEGMPGHHTSEFAAKNDVKGAVLSASVHTEITYYDKSVGKCDLSVFLGVRLTEDLPGGHILGTNVYKGCEQCGGYYLGRVLV